MAIVGNELVVSLKTITGSSIRKLVAFKSAIQTTAAWSAKLTLGLSGLVTASALFANSSIKAGKGIIDFSDQTGIATDQIFAMRNAAIEMGASTQDLMQSLVGLSDKIAQEFISGGSVEAFRALSISARDASGEMRKADDVLVDIARAAKDLNTPAKQSLLDSLGLTWSMIPLLDDFEKLNNLTKGYRQNNPFGRNGVANIREYSKNMERLKENFYLTRVEIGARLAPTLTKILKTINESGAIQQFGRLIADGAEKLAKWVISPAFIDGIKTATKNVKELLKKINAVMTGAEGWGDLAKSLGAFAADVAKAAAIAIKDALAEGIARWLASLKERIRTIMNPTEVSDSIGGGGGTNYYAPGTNIFGEDNASKNPFSGNDVLARFKDKVIKDQIAIDKSVTDASTKQTSELVNNITYNITLNNADDLGAVYNKSREHALLWSK